MVMVINAEITEYSDVRNGQVRADCELSSCRPGSWHPSALGEADQNLSIPWASVFTWCRSPPQLLGEQFLTNVSSNLVCTGTV